MITCPNCKHEDLEGTIFCTECGSQLVEIDHLATQSIRRTTSPLSRIPNVPPSGPLFSGPPSTDVLLSLHFLESGQVVQLTGKGEYTLGRLVEGQASQPDVDLTPFDGYGQGVSRMHAKIKINNQRAAIMDLGSSNGTRVNGQKIGMQMEYPLNHGDVLALGKLKIQFLIRR